MYIVVAVQLAWWAVACQCCSSSSIVFPSPCGAKWSMAAMNSISDIILSRWNVEHRFQFSISSIILDIPRSYSILYSSDGVS